jgi:hypothetical protein
VLFNGGAAIDAEPADSHGVAHAVRGAGMSTCRDGPGRKATRTRYEARRRSLGLN